MRRGRCYYYTYRVGRRITYRGITSNPARRERELQRARPGGRLTIDRPAPVRSMANRLKRAFERAQSQTRTRPYFG